MKYEELTDKDKDYIVRSTESLSRKGRKYGVCAATVQRWIDKITKPEPEVRKFERPKGEYSNINFDKIWNLHMEGETA